MNGDFEYIEPNRIGNIEFSEEQKKIIEKAEGYTLNNIIAMFVMIAFIIIGFLMYRNDIEVYGKPGESALVSASFGICGIFICIFSKNKIKCTASAYGTVIKKEPIVQQIVPRRKYVYKKYSPSPPDTERETVEQVFYYLTLKLADGKYVRYVNCSEKDYLNINEGETILAVCYDLNDIRGYKINGY